MKRESGTPLHPDFIIAGTAKAGTTALWTWLAQHPGIYLPPVKEPGYFAYVGRDPRPRSGPYDRYYYDSIITCPEAYADLFAGADGRLRGEASPIYAIDPDAPARLAMVPGVKVVLSLRSPVARAFSQFSHHQRDGLEPAPDFGQAVRQEEHRKTMGWSPFHAYAGNSLLRPVLSRFRIVVAPENLHVIFHDDMLADPLNAYTRLCDFLGVARDPIPDFARRVNRSADVATTAHLPWLRDRLQRPGPLISRLSKALPRGARQGVRRMMERINTSATPRLDPKVAAELSAWFEADIQWLEQEFNRDLRGWRYE